MSTQADLSKLAIALEYADLGASLYLAGGSDHAAKLLAAAAEQVLGDLARLLGPSAHNDEVQTLLAKIARRYKAAPLEQHNARPRKSEGLAVMGFVPASGNATEEVREATAAYLRAAWYTLESMGLDAIVPLRLQKAVDQSTIYANHS
jgi:NAD(P)-dependent dehydrogenase (short-subunit alcohol dehydrogenase family)